MSKNEKNETVLAPDPVTDVLTGGEIRQGSQRSRRPCADRSRDRRGVARSREHLELLGGSSELQKAGIPARHLDFEFSASRTAGEEVGVKPQQLSLRSSEQEPAQLALVISSVLAKWGLFLKLESGIGHRCYSMSWCQVTVLSRPNSDQATAGQLRSYVCDPSKAPCPLTSSVSRGDPHLGQVCSSGRVESQGWEDTGRES